MKVLIVGIVIFIVLISILSRKGKNLNAIGVFFIYSLIIILMVGLISII